MSVLIKLPLEAEDRPSCETVLHAAGCGPWMWTSEQIRLYRDWAPKQLKLGLVYRLFVDPNLPNEMSGFHCGIAAIIYLFIAPAFLGMFKWAGWHFDVIDAAAMIIGIAFLLSILIIKMFYRGAPGIWSTASDVKDDGIYWREGAQTLLPPLAREMTEDIRVFIPDARFRVTYLKRDPILWLVGDGTDIPRQIAVLVWDEVGRARCPVYLSPELFFKNQYEPTP